MSSSQDFLFAANAPFLEEIYNKYITDPNSVSDNWKRYFENEGNASFSNIPSWGKIRPKIIGVSQEEEISNKNALGKKSGKGLIAGKNDAAYTDSLKLEQYCKLLSKEIIDAYRERGHFLCKLDPLNLEIAPEKSALGLDLKSLGVSEGDFGLQLEFSGQKVAIQELLNLLDNIYCGNIGLETSHIYNQEERVWLCERFEQLRTSDFDSDTKKQALEFLIKTEGFEQYLHVKFPGAKRFSCEGNESSIMAANHVISVASEYGVNDVIIGMAHRGRLATLAGIAQKPYKAIMKEFMGSSAFPEHYNIAGDVKYHMGWSSIAKYSKKEVKVNLLPNPSHLESVNPVLAGSLRAKQDQLPDSTSSVLGVLLHGDAAFCGQGVVAESLNMSGISAYETCGIIHIVTNNQIGYTANPVDGHPGRYSTEFAKVCYAPIIHVNSNNVEDVLRAVILAVEYRQKFRKDVVIDVVGYRKYGHNEGDEPAYTQGVMYSIIRKQKPICVLYAEHLSSLGIIDKSYYEQTLSDFKAVLDKEYSDAKEYKPQDKFPYSEFGLKKCDSLLKEKINTSVSKDQINLLAKKISECPSDFAIHPKLAKILEHRYEEFSKNRIDWSMGEALAFASIINEGINVRITGQDAGRGTFAHRHSVFHDQNTGKKFVPLNTISAHASYYVADSSLSEYAVLGFEYGYSVANPRCLTIWEAQFGDFANGAQIMIDQYISSAETKWLQMSGLVMLLPHGYEGQGPEHSSARLERFLQLAAENNMFIANPTTPASFFHLLRRQVISDFRKPLVVMTPKSLLRHKLAVSGMEDLTEKSAFIPIISDASIDPKSISKVILCTGKIYYDLYEYREANKIKGVAIVRVEQLYLFDEELFLKILEGYKNAKEFVWCQEEPKNMGAWHFIADIINPILIAKNKSSLACVSRLSAASPAVGYLSVHTSQQQNLLLKAFGK